MKVSDNALFVSYAPFHFTLKMSVNEMVFQKQKQSLIDYSRFAELSSYFLLLLDRLVLILTF